MTSRNPTTHHRTSSVAPQTHPSSASSSNKTRQYTHLHAQLAQLNAHLADTENLLRMTSLQAQDMRVLGGYVGALFVGAGRVLGEESVRGRATGMGTGPGGEGEAGKEIGT